MNDKLFIQCVGTILKKCDDGELTDKKGILLLLKLYSKYVNEKVKSVKNKVRHQAKEGKKELLINEITENFRSSLKDRTIKELNGMLQEIENNQMSY